ncbi:hypothetical protein ZPR_1205 [Zunongwangia profunda SM-A87]|uniref:Uncharacterized protein n=1 Tax=Zunongwangia profunda (strain DSM 18752 / CCTCC AB 206139 / SM-A87) TaxID=655815 RepID=D5BIU1_ZUNPS|nr:hypothetical protein ZPR_1205 [Zunongwangia profunda SM-A87]|tara:strand:+ start:3765 stop:3911 length:147 start_codon:yes stop_codon:yes gene_type:complete
MEKICSSLLKTVVFGIAKLQNLMPEDSLITESFGFDSQFLKRNSIKCA